MSKTNYLQAVISDLQRTAGPYRSATFCREQMQQTEALLDQLICKDDPLAGMSRPSALAVLRLITSSNLVGC